tara:strand:+ start:1348 stop:2235 length:888 start_codon:yes stop_codon:yes gene_type:complete
MEEINIDECTINEINETQEKEIKSKLTDDEKNNLKENAKNQTKCMMNPKLVEPKTELDPFTKEEIELIRKNMPKSSLLYNLTKDEFRLWKENPASIKLPKLPSDDDKTFLPKFNTDDFKLSNGEHDAYQEAKTQSFLRLLGYCKLLQVLCSDWLIAERTCVLKPMEAMVWWKVMRNSVFKLCEDYSILEMCEIHTDDIENILDKDGKATGRVRIRQEVINTHACKFPDGSIGIDPAQVEQTNKELREQGAEFDKLKKIVDNSNKDAKRILEEQIDEEKIPDDSEGEADEILEELD